jgi:hypothetical protein
VQFSGVNGYAGSTSSAISEVVTAPAFTSAFMPNALTVASGSSASTTLTLTPVGGYSGTATLACGTLPVHFTCTFTPTALLLSGNNAPQESILNIGAYTPTTAALHLPHGSSKLPEVLTAFALFPGLGFLGLAAVRRRRPDLRKLGLVILLSIATGAGTLGLSGCGSSRPGNYAVPGTYVIPITITANGTTTTVPVNVTVK